MSIAKVVTSQPTPTAPPSENTNLEKSALIEDNVILTQPMLKENIDLKNENVLGESAQPLSENIDDMLSRAEEEGAAKERQRQRNLDFCCFACADSYADDDAFCWYFFCRMLCNGCGHCCEGIANCTDSCCEGCANCCHNCCDGQDGCCDEGGNTGDGGCCDGDGCCDGAGDSGDCDCDCSCFD